MKSKNQNQKVAKATVKANTAKVANEKPQAFSQELHTLANPKAAPAVVAAPAPAVAIHVNKTGRICLSKEAYGIIGDITKDSPYCALSSNVAEGTITLAFSNSITPGYLNVRIGGNRPFVSDTKALKAFGFDGSLSLDPAVTLSGDKTFKLAIAPAVLAAKAKAAPAPAVVAPAVVAAPIPAPAPKAAPAKAKAAPKRKAA